MALTLTSPAFAHGAAIPTMYTCDGADRSPPLAWDGAPDGTLSFALVTDDPDAPDPAAPRRVFVHWILYNIPADVRALPDGVTAKHLPPGTLQGRNDDRDTGYTPPCPPTGRHRYFFRLHALDAELPDLGEPDKPALQHAMKGHVLAIAELMGTYERPR